MKGTMKYFPWVILSSYLFLLHLPVSLSTCPNLCHGHGVCTFDNCECEDLYNLAPDCSLGTVQNKQTIRTKEEEKLFLSFFNILLFLFSSSIVLIE